MMKNDLSLFLTSFVEGEGGSIQYGSQKHLKTVENTPWNNLSTYTSILCNYYRVETMTLYYYKSLFE